MQLYFLQEIVIPSDSIRFLSRISGPVVIVRKNPAKFDKFRCNSVDIACASNISAKPVCIFFATIQSRLKIYANNKRIAYKYLTFYKSLTSLYI